MPKNTSLLEASEKGTLSISRLKRVAWTGPVAQLGARFHGMEEVVSSNLIQVHQSF